MRDRLHRPSRHRMNILQTRACSCRVRPGNQRKFSCVGAPSDVRQARGSTRTVRAPTRPFCVEAGRVTCGVARGFKSAGQAASRGSGERLGSLPLLWRLHGCYGTRSAARRPHTAPFASGVWRAASVHARRPAHQAATHRPPIDLYSGHGCSTGPLGWRQQHRGAPPPAARRVRASSAAGRGVGMRPAYAELPALV